MPEKLPAPLAGTIEQAEPKGASAIAVLLDGAEVVASEELLDPVAPLAVLVSEPQADSVTAMVDAAMNRAPRVRRVLFTSVVLLRIRATAAVMATSREGVLRAGGRGIRHRREPGRVLGEPDGGRPGWISG
jgi:hypothetical protein